MEPSPALPPPPPPQTGQRQTGQRQTADATLAAVVARPSRQCYAKTSDECSIDMGADGLLTRASRALWQGLFDLTRRNEASASVPSPPCRWTLCTAIITATEELVAIAQLAHPQCDAAISHGLGPRPSNEADAIVVDQAETPNKRTMLRMNDHVMPPLPCPWLSFHKPTG